jgi:hypothetical protein
VLTIWATRKEYFSFLFRFETGGKGIRKIGGKKIKVKRDNVNREIKRVKD